MSEDWQSLLQEASRLRQLGRADEAITAYKRVLAINPKLPNAWYNLGWLQKQARAFDDALVSYQRALELDVAEPEEVHVNRAVIYSDHLRKQPDAERELRAALAKNPQYIPALLNLGNLQEDLGNRPDARAAYEKVLAIEPLQSLALARLAGVSHSPELDNGLANRLQSAIALPASAAAGKADLGFALAGLFDASKHYEEAFEAASTANATSRAAT